MHREILMKLASTMRLAEFARPRCEVEKLWRVFGMISGENLMVRAFAIIEI